MKIKSFSTTFYQSFLGIAVMLFAVNPAVATPTVFELYRDITPGAVQARPSNYAIFNGELYFEAANAGDNDEPFKFDGTTLTPLINGSPLAGFDSNLTDQFVFNNRLYAVMESNVGRELFEFNTGTNTYNVHTNLNGAGDGFPRPMTDVNGDMIIFNGHLLMEGDPDGLGDRFYLLRSDNNTLQLLAGATKRDPSNTVVFGGNLYYEADDGAGNDEPFRLVAGVESQIINGAPLAGNDSNLTDQFVFNNRLYAVMESNVGRELFEYNAGTNTYNIHTNLNGANDGFPRPMKDINDDVIIFNGHFLMEGNPDGLGDRFYLLRSDNNTLQLLAGATKRDPSNSALFAGGLYYEADDGAGNDEPFKLVAGVESQIANNAQPVGNDSNLTSQFTYLGDLYAVMESNNGRELYKFNAATSIYERMIDLNGAGDSFPIHAKDTNETVIIYDSAMIFRASDTNLENELYRLRGLATPPDISIADASITEGNAGTSVLNLVVTRTNNTSAVSVNFTTANNTAVAGSDYVANSGTLNFSNGGPLTQNISVTINGDTTVELNESFFVNLNTPTNGAVITDAQGIGTINNNDSASISINDVNVLEGNGATATLTFNASLSAAVDTTIAVNAATADGTATTGSGDYNANSSTLNFAGTAGEIETFSVTINSDTLVELDETILVNLTGLNANGRNVTISDNQGTGTITNDDSAAVSINDVTLAEGNAGTTDFVFTVSLDNAIDTSFSVDTTVTDGTATAADSDFVSSISTLNFVGTAGETQAFAVLVNGDLTVELDETFNAILSNLQASGRSVAIIDNTGLGSIINDDSASLSIAGVSINEGNAGITSFDFVVTLDQAVDSGVIVDLNTSDGTATTAANDYSANSGPLNFDGSAGETQTFSVAVNGDTIVENNENFNVTMSNLQSLGRDVVLSNTTAMGEILNDDSSTVSINDVSILEGNSGTAVMSFDVIATGAVKSGFSLDYSTADGSATAGVDYLATSGTLNFLGTDGEIQNITVSVNGDALVELDETLIVNLSNLSLPEVTFADDQGIGTLSNDDSASISINDVSQFEGDTGTSTFQFEVLLSAAVDVGLSLNAASTDGTATTAANDYVANSGAINFSGNSGETQLFSVTVNGDTAVEANESFSVVLSGLAVAGRDVTFSDDTGLGTITNDDSTNLTIGNASIIEGNAGTVNISIPVTLGGLVKNAVSVDYATADNSALAAEDYVATNGTLNFVGIAGEVQNITITVNGDNTVELNESLLVNLTNVSSPDVTIINSQAVVEITNDDSAEISITDANVIEGISNQMVFTATLSQALGSAISLDYSTSDGTATAGSGDYDTTSGTLNFVGNMGETQDFAITINDDFVFETNETFTVNLNNLVNNGLDITLQNTVATGTIINDDPELTATKTASTDGPIDINSIISYQVELTHTGPTATLVVFNDQPDPAVQLLTGSVTSSSGTIVSGNTAGDSAIQIDLGDLNSPGNSVIITYDVLLDIRLTAGTVISNQGIFTGDNFSDVVTDDPATAAAGDATQVIAGLLRTVPVLSIGSLMLLMLTVLMMAAYRHKKSGI